MKLNSKAGKERRKLGEPNKKRNKKIILLNIGLVFSGAILTIAIYQCVVLNYIRDTERQETIEEITDSNSEYVQAWTLNKEIGQGKQIDIDKDLKQITVSTAGVPTDYIKDKEMIKKLVTRLNLTEHTIISEDMLVDMEQAIKDSTKNQDYDWIKIHAFVKQDDYVDIHYKKLDGSDYIVASKKKLINLNGSVFSTNLEDEDERALINGATVEAAFSGGTLYTSLYPDPENQEAALVTYRVNDTIKKMIEKDPNVLSSAKEKLKSSNSTPAKSSTDKTSNNTSSNSQKTTEVKPPTEMKPPFVKEENRNE